MAFTVPIFIEGFAVPTFSEGFGPSPIEGMWQAVVHCFKKSLLATGFAGARRFIDFHELLNLFEANPQISNVLSDNQESLSKGSANLGFAQHFLKMSQWYRRSALSFNSVLCDKLIDGATSLTSYSKVVSEIAPSIYNVRDILRQLLRQSQSADRSKNQTANAKQASLSKSKSDRFQNLETIKKIKSKS